LNLDNQENCIDSNNNESLFSTCAIIRSQADAINQNDTPPKKKNSRICSEHKHLDGVKFHYCLHQTNTISGTLHLSFHFEGHQAAVQKHVFVSTSRQ